MMDIGLIAAVIAGGGALGVVVWVLAKVGKALTDLAPDATTTIPLGALRCATTFREVRD